MKKLSAKQLEAQREAIDAIVGRDVVVEVDGQRLRLVSPTSADLMRLRGVAASVDEKDPSVGLLIVTEAVRATVPGAAEEPVARDLVLRTGGEMGELGRSALKLCGLGQVVSASVMEDRPT